MDKNPLYPRKKFQSCQFCGKKSNITKEHIFPKYMRDKISERGDFQFEKYEHYDVFAIDSEYYQPYTKTHKNSSETIKALCNKCNNEFSKDIQEGAKNFFIKSSNGYHNYITKEESEKFCRWIILFILTRSIPRINTIFDFEDSLSFRETGLTIRTDIVIFISKYESDYKLFGSDSRVKNAILKTDLE